MTLSGRPLLANRSDARLFVGRERELADVMTARARDLNVLISGESGIGKTSFVQALMHKQRDEEFTYVRAGTAVDGPALLAAIAAAVTGDPNPAGDLATLTALPRQRRAVIVDDVNADAGHAVFGRLRDEIWSLGWQWTVVTPATERAGLLLPPADAFFEHVVELGPLNAPSAAKLLARRLPDWDDVTIKSLVAAIGGSPRRLLDAARAVANDPHRAEELLDALSRRDAAVQAAGRSEAMLAGELKVLGAASASDDALLTRLGWTRSRAVQVLGRLEELGLVRGEDVRTGRGRPRRVFRLVTPDEFAATT